MKNSAIVFVGYGVVAPEYGWDDYKDVDVKGKTILMLINDPQIPDPNDPSKLDDKMFKGRAMTYYGRWTYKYEIASAKGAAAAIIIHETGPAGYPFEVVAGSWGGENFGIQRPDNNMSRVPVEGWMTYDKANELCRMAGLDLAKLKKAAHRRRISNPLRCPAPRPVSKSKTRCAKSNRTMSSPNSKAAIPRSKIEYVIYTAHWDHLGPGPRPQGRSDFQRRRRQRIRQRRAARNRARLYETFARAQTLDSFSLRHGGRARAAGLRILCGESALSAEQNAGRHQYGWAEYLGEDERHDPHRPGKFNVSTISPAAVLKAHGRTVEPDPEPEKGFFYRSDHFEFAKQGVPALDPDSGTRLHR